MNIICFGDSNTYGFDPRDIFGGRYAPEDRWPDILAVRTGWEIVNEGANGRQIPRNPYPLRLLKDRRVELFLIMLGANDLLQGASAEEAAARMEHFLSAILPHFPKLLLVSPPPLKRGAWVPGEELVAESKKLCAEYAALAAKLGIPFVDTSGWRIPLAFDGVHFTEERNRAFASCLIDCLAAHL